MPGTMTIHIKEKLNPTADPLHAKVPHTDDTLVFQASEAEGITFDGDGIVFQSAQAPYTNRVVNSTTVTFSVDHDPAKAEIEWPYHIFVSQGLVPHVIDPTVENDPIPPPTKS